MNSINVSGLTAGNPANTPPQSTEPARPLNPDAGSDIDSGLVPGCTPSSQDFSESCDGKDNDCDGKIDEGFSSCRPGAVCTEQEQRPCESECGKGVYVCQNGAWSSCTITEPKKEACNGVDDDCDGQTDEGACTGPTGGTGGAPQSGGFANQGGTSGAPQGGMMNAVGGQPEAGGTDVGGQPASAGMPVNPEPARCQGHGACDNNEFCYSGQCFDGLPGDYAFTIISARFEGVDDIGSDPDVYAKLLIDGRSSDERRTPKLSDARYVRWNHVIRPVRLRPRQDIEVCVYDADPFNDDEIGCIRFTAENVVQVIRQFDPALQPGNRPLWASVMPELPVPVPDEGHLTEFIMTVERLITR